MGKFDLDPCSPIKRPWDTAKKHYTELDKKNIYNGELLKGTIYFRFGL